MFSQSIVIILICLSTLVLSVSVIEKLIQERLRSKIIADFKTYAELLQSGVH